MSEDIDEIKRNLKSDVVKDRKLGQCYSFYYSIYYYYYYYYYYFNTILLLLPKPNTNTSNTTITNTTTTIIGRQGCESLPNKDKLKMHLSLAQYAGIFHAVLDYEAKEIKKEKVPLSPSSSSSLSLSLLLLLSRLILLLIL